MADDPDQQPTFWHGLMAGLQQAPANPLVNIGLGLMSAARPYGNVGEELMKANQATLQNRGMQQQQQLFQAKLPGLQQYYNRLAQLPNMSPQGGGQSGVPSMSMDPQAAVDTGTLGAAMGIEGAGALTKYPENISAAQKALQQQKQMQVQGPLALYKSISSSPEADAIVKNDPKLLGQFSQDAPQLGVQALTPQTARTWATFAHNKLAGPAGLPAMDMPQPLTTTKGPNGQIQQTNPVSGKTDVAIPAQPLTPVVGQGGLPTLTPSGQAAGKQPFNEQIYGANSISDPAMERAYQQWKATGAVPAGQGRNVLAQAKQANFIAQRANDEGVPEQAAAAKQQQFKAQQAVLDDFTNPSGKAGASLVAINTAVNHFQALTPLIDAMQSGNMTKINEARQFFQKQTGQPATTNYQALANMAAGEASKAVFAGGGGEAERDEVASPFKSVNGPEALKGAVQTVSTALAGKTDALRNAWEVGTQGTQGPFDKLLLPATKKALGISESGPIKVSSPAEAMALKPGTVFITPDGRQKIR